MIGKSTILSAIDSYHKQDDHKAIGSGKWYSHRVVVIKSESEGMTKWEVKELGLFKRIAYFLKGELQLLKSFRKNLNSELKMRKHIKYTTNINDNISDKVIDLAFDKKLMAAMPFDFIKSKPFDGEVSNEELTSYLLDLNDAIMESGEDGREYLIGHLTAKIDVISQNKNLFGNPKLLAATFTCLATAIEYSSDVLIKKMKTLLTKLENPENNINVQDDKKPKNMYKDIIYCSTVAPAVIKALNNAAKCDKTSFTKALEEIQFISAIKNSGFF